MNQPSSLPYQDTKPQGAADFYLCINATFRFIRERLGEDGLRRYWRNLGESYFAPVSRLWAEGGLPAVDAYWRDFFAAEPGAEVDVQVQPNQVSLEIRKCPAIAHLRQSGRAIEPLFCQHCYYVSEVMAEKAGLSVRLQGGNGACTQQFQPARESLPPQDLRKIIPCA